MTLGHKLRSLYPDRVPVIVNTKSENISLKKQKFLVPEDIIVGQFMYELRKYIESEENISQKTFYLLSENILISNSFLVCHYWKIYKNENDFLELTLCEDNVFGFFSKKI